MTGQPTALFTSGPFYGHMRPLLVQADELRQRGWRVVFASLDEARRYITDHSRVCFASLGPSGASDEEIDRFRARITMERDFGRSMLLIGSVLRRENWARYYHRLHEVLQREQPQVVIADLINTSAISATERSGLACVINNADLLTVLPAGLLPPAPHVPLLLSGKSIRSIDGLSRRLYPLRRAVAIAVGSLLVSRSLNGARRSVGLAPVNVHRWLADKVILVNSAFGLEYRRPLPPCIHMVGPMFPSQAESLPRDYEEWLADGPPVVYVNLGTIAKPWPELLRRMAVGLRAMPYRALWVLPTDLQPLLPDDLPASIRVESWVPSQLAILQHANVRTFVSHCGVNSVHESLWAGTPVVGIPLFAAQGDMAQRIQDAGVGVFLDKHRFTPDQLREAVMRADSSALFRANLSVIQASFTEAGGVQRAADLIELAARSA